MTETRDPNVINDALALIDKGLGQLQYRELVSTGEMTDLLLDVRSTLTAKGANTVDDEAVPVPG